MISFDLDESRTLSEEVSVFTCVLVENAILHLKIIFVLTHK